MPNESLIHADIFFFISTMSLVVLSIGLGIVLFYLIKILKNVREFSDRFRAEGAEIAEDIKKFRAVLREEGVKWRHVISLIRAFFVRKAEKPPAAKKSAGKAVKVQSKVE